MRALLLLPLLALVASAADEDRPARAREDAWEAHLLAKTGDASYVPDLRRLLRRYRESDGEGAHVVRQTILDALIQLNATMPARELLPMRKSHPAPVFILLARNAKANRQALFEIMRGDASRLEWIAAGNLLAPDPPRGFSAYVLSRYPVMLHVRVIDKQTASLRASRGHDQRIVVRRQSTVGKGWPPQAMYVLMARGGEPLAPGSRTIYFRRNEFKAGSTGFAAEELAPDQSAVRQEYLALLLGMKREQVWVLPHHDIFPVWSDAETLQTDIDRARSAIGINWDGMKARLVKRGKLTEEEAKSLRLRLETTIEDERTDKTEPLPVTLLESGPEPPK